MRPSGENEVGLWQLRIMSWLPEEEDRQRLRDGGFEALRIRDAYEFDETGICRENYFNLSNDDMRAAGRRMARWGYGPSRPMNTLPNEGFLLIDQLTARWHATLEDFCEDAVLQMLRQGGRECSGALWSNSGTCMRLFWREMKVESLPFCGPMKTVLFNDVLKLLQGAEPEEERAQWWLNQGIPGVLIRFMQDGIWFRKERGLEIPELTKPEGEPERLARLMLYDPDEMGRMFRDLIEQDLVKGVLERGFEGLLSQTTPSLYEWVRSVVHAGLGDWVLEPWWAISTAMNGDTLGSHMVCSRGRRMKLDEKDADPRYVFELTEDDRELLRHWVLQNRARLLTGRWEYSPAWGFYQVPIQIFWLHGLENGESAWYEEHNGWELTLAYETITEHIVDVESRWIPNDSTPPKLNELDWRFREVILPEVERLAQEFCDSVGEDQTMKADPRWTKEFEPWLYSPSPEEEEAGFGIGLESLYAASSWTKAEAVSALLKIFKAKRWEPEELTDRKLASLWKAVEKLPRGEGLRSWCELQGWDTPDELGNALFYLKSLS